MNSPCTAVDGQQEGAAASRLARDRLFDCLVLLLMVWVAACGPGESRKPLQPAELITKVRSNLIDDAVPEVEFSSVGISRVGHVIYSISIDGTSMHFERRSEDGSYGYATELWLDYRGDQLPAARARDYVHEKSSGLYFNDFSLKGEVLLSKDIRDPATDHEPTLIVRVYAEGINSKSDSSCSACFAVDERIIDELRANAR